MATYKDRIKESTNVLGVDPAPLQGVQLGFKAFSTLGDGASVYYTIQGRGTGEFEVGLGTYNLGANTITRGGVVSSSNSDNLVFFSAGTKDIFLTYPANQIPTAMDSATAQAGTSTTPKTVSASVLNGAVEYGAFTPSGTGAVSRTVQSKLRDVVSVFDFMTPDQIADVQAGTLLVDVSLAVAKAIQYVTILMPNNQCKGLYFPNGSYLISENNWIGNNLSITGVYSGRLDIIFCGSGRNSSVIIFKPTVANAACYNQNLTPYATLNGFKVEKMGFIFDNSANGNQPIHFISSKAIAGLASQNFRLNETRFYGVTGSNLFILGGTSANEDVISVYDTSISWFNSAIVSTTNIEALLHNFYAFDALNITGTLFDYAKGGSLKVYGCNAIMEGTTGVDTAVFKTSGGTTSQIYAFDNLRVELRGANTRLLYIPTASENIITFTNCLAANTPSGQAWAKTVSQHHSSIVFKQCLFPLRTGVGDIGTFQLIDSPSGFDYSTPNGGHSFIKFIDCTSSGDLSNTTGEGWVDYSHLTAASTNYRTLQVVYSGCTGITDSVEYGHIYRLGNTYTPVSPVKLIFRGTTFPYGDGVSAPVVSNQDLRIIIPLNNFVTEITVMRKAMATVATNYQIEFIDETERLSPGTGVIFGSTTIKPNNQAIFERVIILRQFTGTLAQRTLWCRMKAGFTLGVGLTGSPTDGGIYVETI